MKRAGQFSRRRLLGVLASAGAAASARSLFMAGSGLLIGSSARAQSLQTRLILLGTQGGPNFNPERSESASALVIGDEIYLVDCGYGALARIREAGLVYRDIANIFLTHLHDDHTSDVAALLSHQWSDGRIDSTAVHGPHGTPQLVDAALQFAQANTQIRLADEDRSVLPADMFHGHEVRATSEPALIYEDDYVRVSSVENTHYPDSARQATPHRALSYRFDSADRSVTFSGDTAYAESLVELARGTDVFVCEAMHVESMRRAFETMVAGGAYADNAEGVWAHIVSTHTSTEEAGRMATEAGARQLVLNHLIPGALMEVPDEIYLEGARRSFDGEVIVGRDLLEI